MTASFEHRQSLEWERTRNLEFSIYSSTVNFDGKQVFKVKKPIDMYSLPTDKRSKIKPAKIDKGRQKQSVERVKNTKNYKEWLKKN